MLRLVVLSLVVAVGACTFDERGTRAGWDPVELDAARASPDAGGDDVTVPDADPAPDAAPDAEPPEPDASSTEDMCGMSGESCCEQGPACRGLGVCLGGTCV
jgi:hypothetical protein